jgi:hypothetical protein
MKGQVKTETKVKVKGKTRPDENVRRKFSELRT